jgi:hypothetical protein
MLEQDLLGPLVRRVNESTDLVVDLAGDLVRIAAHRGVPAPEERLRMLVAEDSRPERRAHAEARDHLPCHRGDGLEVVRRAGGELARTRSVPPRGRRGSWSGVAQLRLGREELLLRRQRDPVPQRLSAPDDRDLVDRIGVLEEWPTVA